MFLCTMPKRGAWSGARRCTSVSGIRLGRAQGRTRREAEVLIHTTKREGHLCRSLTRDRHTGRNALEVSHLSYRPVSAPVPLLNDVSFSLSENTLGLIVGPSGSGKSTLLHVLAGLSPSYSGSIKLPSSAASQHSEQAGIDEQLRQNVGVVFQFPERYFVGNNLMDELSYGWRHSNQFESRTEFAKRLPRVLQVAGLSELPLDKELKELSGGYQRRVAIAVQLLQNPSVLLLDEPTAGMDLSSCRSLCATLREIKRTSAILVVSHDTDFLTEIADHTWEMKRSGHLTSAAIFT